MVQWSASIAGHAVVTFYELMAIRIKEGPAADVEHCVIPQYKNTSLVPKSKVCPFLTLAIITTACPMLRHNKIYTAQSS